ncbi:hypothetical protein QTP81_01400 [Alteromonas sp. ASW11-36]|uniref:Uncharacterized protein n=1 Tax=Alteromonas arenosi TaxID=3055817 RepID=A0ABT7SUQ2_9ALTE|nr:hypothetical protein [Alteromonas sp. ASW11-36]MDM7859259.1 hypothetical protein [Alteromonas sp. ASW11-36]
MQYKMRILGAVLLGFVAIIVGMYGFPSFEEHVLNSDSTKINTSEPDGSEKEYARNIEQALPIQTGLIFENAKQIYAASEAYSQCETENKGVRDRLETINESIMKHLRDIDENNLIRDAVFLLQAEGYFQIYEALSTLHKLQLVKEAEHFQQAPLRPTQEEIDELTSTGYYLRDVLDAVTQYDIELTIIGAEVFRQNNNKRGLLFRRGKDKLLWSPDVFIGHNLAAAPTYFVDDIAAQYPVSQLLFTQAVRSRASIEVLEKLLSSFNYNNSPVFTKHSQLQTALQAAIEIESLEVMRLILSQPDLQHTEFFFNPLNTIIFETLNTESQEFTDTHKSMMALLVERGFMVDVVPGPFPKSLMLAGYPAMLDRPVVDQLNALSIPPKHIEKLRIHPDSELPLNLQDQLKREAYDSKLLLDEHKERVKTCDSLKQNLQSLVPPLASIDDIVAHLSADKGYVENIQLLEQQSLTLVDAFYSKMEREPRDTQGINVIAASTLSLKDIPDTVQAQIDQLTPFERHYLTEVYCEKFGKRYMEEIFDAVQYMSFNLLSHESCLAGSPHDYIETERIFYLHENTYPGIVYSELKRYAIGKAIDLLADPAFQRPKDLQGYPHGRDALMLALDLKLAAHSLDKEDYKKLIIDLIARTELKAEHLKRLHRLKVEHFMFFEDIALIHPQIRQAVGSPLVRFRTFN